MRHHRVRRFRHRSNGRDHQLRKNGIDQSRFTHSSFSNDRIRNSFKTEQNVKKLFEKYTALAKEALSSGDRILSENYFQHADHFKRIIDERNLNQIQKKPQEINETTSSNSADNNETHQNIEKNK